LPNQVIKPVLLSPVASVISEASQKKTFHAALLLTMSSQLMMRSTSINATTLYPTIAASM